MTQPLHDHHTGTGLAVSGPHLDAMLGGDSSARTTLSARAARLLGMPKVGHGQRRTFTLGQTVAALSAAYLAGHPHALARGLVYQYVAPMVDRYSPRFVLVACCDDCGPWVSWSRDEAGVAAVIDSHRGRASVMHVLDVDAVVSTIERTRPSA